MARRPLRAPGKVMKGRQGYTLIEVVVAMLLSCVMIASVFSVALSNKVASSKIDHSLVAVQASRSLQENCPLTSPRIRRTRSSPGPLAEGRAWPAGA